MLYRNFKIETKKQSTSFMNGVANFGSIKLT